MARAKAVDYYPIYNNIAKRKGVPPIPVDTKMTLDEIANKIEWVNKLKEPNKKKPKIPQGRHKVLAPEDLPKERWARWKYYLFGTVQEI